MRDLSVKTFQLPQLGVFQRKHVWHDGWSFKLVGKNRIHRNIIFDCTYKASVTYITLIKLLSSCLTLSTCITGFGLAVSRPIDDFHHVSLLHWDLNTDFTPKVIRKGGQQSHKKRGQQSNSTHVHKPFSPRQKKTP